MTDYSKMIKFLNGLNESKYIDPANGMVYHYTSAEVFNSIISKGTLRFTDRNYLNDKSEGVYVLQVISESHFFLNVWSSEAIAEKFKIVCEKRKKNPNKKYRHICQCSFSTESDSLSMWNYYSKNNQLEGFNIAFNADELKNTVCQLDVDNEKKTKAIFCKKAAWKDGKTEIKAFSGKIIYEKEKQKEIIIKIIETAEKYMRDNIDQDDYELFLDCILDKILDVGVFFKNKAFENEYEFRIVFYFYECEYYKAIDEKSTEGVSVRIPYQFVYKNNFMIPYVDLQFDKKFIKGITMSPTLNDEASKASIEDFLRINGMGNIRIKSSEIPVRY